MIAVGRLLYWVDWLGIFKVRCLPILMSIFPLFILVLRMPLGSMVILMVHRLMVYGEWGGRNALFLELDLLGVPLVPRVLTGGFTVTSHLAECCVPTNTKKKNEPSSFRSSSGDTKFNSLSSNTVRARHCGAPF